MKHHSSSHPIMNIPDQFRVFDLASRYEPEEIQHFIESGGWGVGGYLENRKAMYTAPQYENKRRVHMGIDIWAAAGEPVYSPLDGTVAYKVIYDEPGNYGGTIVLRMCFEARTIYGLFGHLSWGSVENAEPGRSISAGEQIGRLGVFEENGNWPPHLHFQISIIDPGKADMPGVVTESESEPASLLYPDPRMILGPIY